mgnify:CR=1 FL=1
MSRGSVGVVAECERVSVHDELGRCFDAVAVCTAGDELADGPASGFLHRDSLGLGSEGLLFGIGEP